jgi:hypothetical protein
MAVLTDNLGYTSHGGSACDIVGRAKRENDKISLMPDEDRTMGAMGDKPVFRMLESYTNLTIDWKMRLVKNKSTAVPVRAEVEKRQETVPDAVASCPLIVDDMLLAGEDAEAAAAVEASIKAFESEAHK